MPQTIKIFHYESPLSIGQIFNKLSQKNFPIVEIDENNPDNEITFTHEIEKLHQHAFGIMGGLTYYSQKEYEFAEGTKFYTVPRDFGFLFSPQNQIIIFHGDSEYYVRVLKFFNQILHSGDDLIQSIHISKEKMNDLMWKIIRIKSGKNNLEQAAFFHNAKPLGTLKRLSFTTVPEACGTDHSLFKKNYNNCTHWGATIRIYKCNGLLDLESKKGYLLRMNHDGKFSSTMDCDLKQWNRFVVETVKTTVGF